jgi:hypothetical protein
MKNYSLKEYKEYLIRTFLNDCSLFQGRRKWFVGPMEDGNTWIEGIGFNIKSENILVLPDHHVVADSLCFILEDIGVGYSIKKYQEHLDKEGGRFYSPDISQVYVVKTDMEIGISHKQFEMLQNLPDCRN